MECYASLKRKGFLSHATPWMKPEDTILSEINQSPNNKYSMILLIRDI